MPSIFLRTDIEFTRISAYCTCRKQNLEDDITTAARSFQKMHSTFPISVRDVEGSIKSFDRDGKHPVEKWIRYSFNFSQIIYWSENNIKSYDYLIRALIPKFSTRVSSALLHEFFLVIKEIAVW